jgi:hypothetical protein
MFVKPVVDFTSQHGDNIGFKGYILCRREDVQESGDMYLLF